MRQNAKTLIEEQFIAIKKGDKFLVCDLDGRTPKYEIAEDDAFYNADCDEPGFEVTAESGPTYCYGDVYDFILGYDTNQIVWREQYTWGDVLDELPTDLSDFFDTMTPEQQQNIITRFKPIIENGVQAGLMEIAGNQVFNEAVTGCGMQSELFRLRKEAAETVDDLTEKLNQIILDSVAAELLSDVFCDELHTDDEDPAKVMNCIAARYLNANKAERAVIDEIFQALCGWEFKTLVKDRAGLTPSKEAQLQNIQKAYLQEVDKHDRNGRLEADQKLYEATCGFIRQYQELYPNAVLVKTEPFEIKPIPEKLYNYDANYIVDALPGDFQDIEAVVKEAYANVSIGKLSIMEKKLKLYNAFGLIWS